MNLKALVQSSVGQKFVVGITAVALCGFVLMHMSGNMLLFCGPEAYNTYSYKLVTNPLLPVAEIGLLTALLLHVGFAISVTIRSRRARPVGVALKPNSAGKDSSLAARSMIYSGLLTFVFLVLHLWTFKYGTHYAVTYNGVEMRDLYRLIAEKFREPMYVAWYEVCLVVLFLHLSHGFASMFQSLGGIPVRTPVLKKLSYAFALIVAGGFISQPLLFFFTSQPVIP